MWFARQEYWSGLPFPSPAGLPDPGMEPASPALAGRFLPLYHLGRGDALRAQQRTSVSLLQTPMDSRAWGPHSTGSQRAQYNRSDFAGMHWVHGLRKGDRSEERRWKTISDMKLKKDITKGKKKNPEKDPWNEQLTSENYRRLKIKVLDPCKLTSSLSSCKARVL